MDAERTELRTQRLLLRPFAFTDVEDVLAYGADDEWARYLDVPRPYGRPEAERFIAGCLLRSWAEQPEFAVVFQGTVVGGVTLRIDAVHHRAELGYSIARPLWGRGLATEAARAVIDYGFEACNLDKIFAAADHRNAGSLRVMQKLGMQHEGLLRAHRLLRGERLDMMQYALLRAEWRPDRA